MTWPELLQAEAAPDQPDQRGRPLRALDRALARLLLTLDPGAPESLLLATALLANLEGRGHSCLHLPDLFSAPEALLDTPGGPLRKVVDRIVALSGEGGTAEGLGAAWTQRPVLQGDSSPLVLHGQRLYLRRYWQYERQIAAQVTARAAATVQAVDPIAARGLLDRLFSTSADNSPAAFDWQKAACALSLRGRLMLITGGPGTGKTFTAARLLVLHQALHQALHPGPEPLRVALAAPTGKAAARLRQSIAQALQGLQAQVGDQLPLQAWADTLGPARTLHRLLGARPDTRRFQHDAANPLDLDLLIVDEASMVHLEMMGSLMQALSPTARVVLLGDKDQLASVEAGAVLGDLCQGAAQGHYDDGSALWLQALTGQTLPVEMRGTNGTGPALAQQTVMLRQSRRFDGPIGTLAAAVNAGEAVAATRALREGGDAVAWWPVADPSALLDLALNGRGVAPGYRAFLALLPSRPAAAGDFDAWALQLLGAFDGFRLLCALREGPWGVTGLNSAIERALSSAGLLQRRGPWYEGRPVMVTRNEPDLGVFNGDIGVALRAPGGSLRVYFADGQQLRSVAVGRLADVQTAWAMTVHKSQGSEFGHVALVLPDDASTVLTRELVYTGITRARQAFTLAGSRFGALADAVQRVTRRSSGLHDLLQASAPGRS